MAREYSQMISEAVQRYLEEDDWKYRFIKGEGIFVINVATHGMIKRLEMIVKINKNDFSVNGMCSFRGNMKDEARKNRIIETISRINYGLISGCFEVDVDDGDIRYKVYVDCEDIEPSNAIIENALLCVAAMFSRYGEALGNAVFGSEDVKDVVRKCEQNDFRDEEELVDDDEESLHDMIERLTKLMAGQHIEAADDEEGEEEEEAEETSD